MVWDVASRRSDVRKAEVEERETRKRESEREKRNDTHDSIEHINFVRQEHL